MDIRDHSIYFDEYNTWDIWRIVPTSRPTPSIPEVITKMVEVPGRSGSLDMSEALTHFPIYENRSLSVEFMVVDQKRDWMDIYMDITAKLHGKRMQIRLTDNPGWYYTGRVSVSEFNSNSDYSSIGIEVDLDPFKISEESTLIQFNEDDIIEEDSNKYFDLYMKDFMSPACQVVNPKMWLLHPEVSSRQSVDFTNTELNYHINSLTFTSSKTEMDDILLSNFNRGNVCRFKLRNYLSGTGVCLEFTEKRI